MSSGDLYQGRRVYHVAGETRPTHLEPCDYMYDPVLEGWLVMPPNGIRGLLGDNHTFTVGEFGQLTVSPSLLFDKVKDQYWHGWLENGVWREA